MRLEDLSCTPYALAHNTSDHITTPEFHQHDFYEIYFYLSGSATIVIEEFSYRLQSGDVVLLPPGRMHRAVHHAEYGCYERYLLYATSDCLRQAGTADYPLLTLFEAAAGQAHFVVHPSGADFLHVLSLMNEALETDDAHPQQRLIRDHLLALVLARVCGWFCTLPRADAAPTAHALYGVISYINAHLDSDLSLDALAARFDMNKYNLLRLFKDYAQVTLHQYILQKRISRAKDLLRDGMSPSQVYAACGYYDSSGFYKAFRTHTGMTPQQYADSVQQP